MACHNCFCYILRGISRPPQLWRRPTLTHTGWSSSNTILYLQFLGWRSCVCMRRCCQDGTWCSYSTGRYMQNWRQYLSIWRWELSLYTDRATKIPKRRLGGLTQLNKNTTFSFTVQFQQYKITRSHQVWLLVKMRYILPGMLCMTKMGLKSDTFRSVNNYKIKTTGEAIFRYQCKCFNYLRAREPRHAGITNFLG